MIRILKPLKCAPQRVVNALPAAGLFPLTDRPLRGRLLRRFCSALFLVYLRSTVRQTLFTGKAVIQLPALGCWRDSLYPLLRSQRQTCIHYHIRGTIEVIIVSMHPELEPHKSTDSHPPPLSPTLKVTHFSRSDGSEKQLPMPTKLGYRSAKSVSYSPKTSDYSLN